MFAVFSLLLLFLGLSLPWFSHGLNDWFDLYMSALRTLSLLVTSSSYAMHIFKKIPLLGVKTEATKHILVTRLLVGIK